MGAGFRRKALAERKARSATEIDESMPIVLASPEKGALNRADSEVKKD